MNVGRRLLDRAPKGDFVRGAATIAGATGAAQAIGILSSPIITRLYSPSEYGAFAVAGAILFLLVAVACLRYDLAIPLPRADGDAAKVVAVCLVVTAIVTLASIPILVLIGPWVLDLAGAGSLKPFVLLLSVGVVSGGIFNALIGWMIRTKSYGEIAANRLTQSGTVVAVQVGLGLLGAGAAGLLLGTIIGSFAGVWRLARAAWRRSHEAFRGVTRDAVSATARRYRRFPIYSSPSIAINILGLDMPLLWIAAAYGADAGGQFALAQRVVALPVTVLAGAVGQVYFAEAAKVAQTEPAALSGLFKRTTRSLALTAILPFTAAAILSPILFPIIFGPAWKDAGIFVAVLAPMFYFQFVAWPTGGTLDVLERQDLHLLRETGRLILVLTVVAFSTAMQLQALGAVVALSVAGSITNIAYGLVSWRAIAQVGTRPPAGGSSGGAPRAAAAEAVENTAANAVGQGMA